MLSKLDLCNRINEYMYAYGLENLGIFSKNYMHSIILPKYSNNNSCNPYSIISIDFNNMNDINNSKGYEFGNLIIYKVLDLIVNNKNCSLKNNCFRIGGDEFLIILDNISLEDSRKIIESIHETLEKHKSELYNTSITAFAVNSKNYNNLSEMLDIAEQEIGYQKKHFNLINTNSSNSWNVIENQLTETFNTLFKSLRLYKDTLETNELKQLYLSIIDSTSKLLEHSDIHLPDCSNTTIKNAFDINQATLLDSIFRFENPAVDDNIDYATCGKLLNLLVREPNTNRLSKPYLIKYLLQERGLTLNSKYFSTAFVKLHNTLYSYNDTDEDIKVLMQNLFNYCNKQIGEGNVFNENLFSNENDKYFIDLGAGDFLLAFDTSIDISSFNFENYIESNKKITSKNDKLLRLACNNNYIPVNSSNINNTLIEMSNECKQNKNEYKIDLLNSKKFTEVTDILLNDIIEYYIENIHDYNDIEAKCKFLNLASNSALNSLQNFNELQHKDIKNSNDFNER